jgi:hypothetical protein
MEMTANQVRISYVAILPINVCHFGVPKIGVSQVAISENGTR